MNQDIEGALENSIIIADSIEELYRIQQIADSRKQIVEIGIRVNPNFTMEGDTCQFNKFGIDEDQAITTSQIEGN